MPSADGTPRRSATDREAQRRREKRGRHVGFWVFMAIANAILVPILVSLFIGFGVVWSSGGPGSSWERHTMLGCRGGKFGWRRYEVGTSPWSSGAPVAVATYVDVTLAGWAKPASAGWWLPAAPGAPLPAGTRVRTVTVPFWMPLLPLGIGLAVLARKEHRSSLRARRGCCRVCGYDLKGLPGETAAARVCPECGTRRRVPSRADVT